MPKKKPPKTIRIKEYERTFQTPVAIPRDRPFTDEEKTLLESRLRRVKLWEEFYTYVLQQTTKIVTKGSKYVNRERAWKDAARAFQKQLLEAEFNYRIGRELSDYGFAGKPEEWNQDAIEAAHRRLLDPKHKPPRKTWDYLDDMEWVNDRLYVDNVVPEDFPTQRAFTEFCAAKQDPLKFIEHFRGLQRSIMAKKYGATKDKQEEKKKAPPKEKEVPFEETDEYKTLKALKTIFGDADTATEGQAE